MIVIIAVTIWCLACHYAAGYICAYLNGGDNEQT